MVTQTAEQNRKAKKKAGGVSLKQAAAAEAQRRRVAIEDDSDWSPKRRSPEEAAAALAAKIDRSVEAVEARRIPIANIEVTAANPRTTFEAEKIASLATNIADVGLIEPIVVRLIDTATQSFELVAGERRLRACKSLGWETIPATVRDLDEAEAVIIRATENLERENLNAIEEANAYAQMLAATHSTQEQLAKRLGVAQPTIANRLRLLKLPKKWQGKIADGSVSASVGREIVPYLGHASLLRELEANIFGDDQADDEESDYLDDGPVQTRDVQRIVRQAVWAIGERARSSTWVSALQRSVEWSVELTDDVRKKYGVVEVPEFTGSPNSIAFATESLKEFEKLVKAAETRAIDAAMAEPKTKGDGKSKAKGQGGAATEKAKPTAAELRKKREQREKAVADYGRRCRNDWLRPLIAARLRDRQARRLLFWWFGEIGRGGGFDGWPHHGFGLQERRGMLFEAIGEKTTKPGSYQAEQAQTKALFAFWSTLAEGNETAERAILTNATHAIAKSCLVDDQGGPRPWVPAELLDSLSMELGIDEPREWRMTADFLDYFTKEEIAALGNAAGSSSMKPTGPKSELIDTLLMMAPGYMPGCVKSPYDATPAEKGAKKKGARA